MSEDDRYSTFVAEDDGRIVGLVTIVTAMAIGHPNGYTKINGLGVLPEYRYKGIGGMLLKRAEELAIENGTRYIGLASGFNRKEAHAFYEHMGYRKTSYWFRKSL
jgi:GNAT superfamily N-acetyltransferase